MRPFTEGDVLGLAAIEGWLRETDEGRLEGLWQAADRVRAERVGEAVHLRGLLEISNYCVRRCAYCGIAACAGPLERYRLSHDEIVAGAREAQRFGFGTVVLQSGEDPGLTREFIAGVVAEIDEMGLAITLSLGERDDGDLRAWREAGADRYLLRFETTDPDLYAAIHPGLPGQASDRIAQLVRMRDMGYEVGTGVMVGIPGQTWTTLARDIDTFRRFDMDMIGIGPYLPSPSTPLAGPLGGHLRAPAGEQVPNDEVTTLKAVALTRLVCPDTNIPSTTALSILDPGAGRRNGLTRGANVVMPNLTPPRYRQLYQIYPGKAAVHESVETLTENVYRLIASLGRTVGQGAGERRGRTGGSGI